MPHTHKITKPGEKPVVKARDAKKGEYFVFIDKDRAPGSRGVPFARTFDGKYFTPTEPGTYWTGDFGDSPVEILPPGTKIEITVG